MLKRILLTTLLLLSARPGLNAQNNAYGIDDECYQHMMAADRLIGKDGFEEQNEALLQAALKKGDKKARNLYYVEQLRNLTARPGTDDLQVLAAHELLKQMSRELGYEQYFYQSYQTTKNYFFNKGQRIKSMELIQEMQRTAAAEGSEYGMWVSEKELASFYQIFGAGQLTRDHLRKLIRIHETSENPTIRRQSICQSYLDYAATFSPDLDSVKFFVDKAWAAARSTTDTIRCNRDYAKIAAIAGNAAAYRRYRDACLSSGNPAAIGRYTPPMFEAIDALFSGTYVREARTANKLPAENARIIGSVAESQGRFDIAGDIKDYCLNVRENDMGKMLDMNLSEMDARYGNDLLEASLAEKSRQVERTTRWIMVLVAVLLLAGLLFFYFRFRTQQKALEKDEKMIADLQAANEKARIADETKTRFLQNMTHELRTPLNAITGFSQLLALPDGTFPPEEKNEFSQHILNNTSMLTMLLDDIIQSSAMDAGGYKVNIGDAECERICHLALKSVEHRLQPGVQLKFCPAMALPFHFQTDPLRVQQLLTNMLTNACKHTREGEIRLGCSLDEAADKIRFSIEDTGPGIPADQAERIFERFVKLNEFVQGTGLGLSICREIAGKLDGRVWLDTSYTGGARFLLELPLHSHSQQ